jgi:hypothetical protein
MLDSIKEVPEGGRGDGVVLLLTQACAGNEYT